MEIKLDFLAPVDRVFEMGQSKYLIVTVSLQKQEVVVWQLKYFYGIMTYCKRRTGKIWS